MFFSIVGSFRRETFNSVSRLKIQPELGRRAEIHGSAVRAESAVMPRRAVDDVANAGNRHVDVAGQLVLADL